MNATRTVYFTFGQSHAHSVGGFIYDKDVVVRITAEDPYEVMFKTFGEKWSMAYVEPPDMAYFPRGIVDLKGGTP